MAASIQRPLPAAFWKDPDIRRMSKQAQGLAAFLLTRPFRAGTTLAEVAQKSGIKPHVLRTLFRELETNGWAWVHLGEVKLTGLKKLNAGAPT